MTELVYLNFLGSERAPAAQVVDIYLASELSGAHHFNDVERCPGDVITQHLQLFVYTCVTHTKKMGQNG